jgi:hypothetical protein
MLVIRKMVVLYWRTGVQTDRVMERVGAGLRSDSSFLMASLRRGLKKFEKKIGTGW